jgi:hypothetical protein
VRKQLERMTFGTPALATRNKQNIIFQYNINMSINTINTLIAEYLTEVVEGIWEEKRPICF